MPAENESGEGLVSPKSTRAAGMFLMLTSIPLAMATNRETPLLALGLFPCGVLFYLASMEFVRRIRLLAPILVLAGLASCGAIVAKGYQGHRPVHIQGR